MIPFSVLDLSPVAQGSSAAQSLRNTLDLARHAEGWGYHRYWLAEHHSMPGIASAATSVVIGHVAAGTQSIRVGAGGIMLPNHSPLVIAEQFGTLESLFPGRIDLGLGRAPGSDQATARALRRNLASDPDQFPTGRHGIAGLPGPHGAGTTSDGLSGCGHPGASVDIGVEPVRRPGCRGLGAALRLRLALRPRHDDAGHRDLSRPIPAVGAVEPAVCDAGVQCVRRGFRCAGSVSVLLDAAGLHQFAQRPGPASFRRPSRGTRSSCSPRAGRCWPTCSRVRPSGRRRRWPAPSARSFSGPGRMNS